MDIKIKCEGERGKAVIHLSDDDLNNLNYVDMMIIEEDGDTISVIVPVQDLYQAVMLFDNLRLEANDETH